MLNLSFHDICSLRVRLRGTLFDSFYSDKSLFYHGKLNIVSMTNISGINFPWLIYTHG